MFLDLALLVLRVGFGGLMLFGHGLGKLMSFSDLSRVFPDPLHVTSPVSLALTCFSEVLCAGFVMLGFATRLSVIPLIINMLVAFVLVHAGDPWSKRELAVVYLIPFITIALAGPGRLSLDSVFGWFKGSRR
jgi:putative oxidoreductase